MKKYALFLILAIFFSGCMPSKNKEGIKDRLNYLRQLKKEDDEKIRQVKKFELEYKSKGIKNKQANEQYIKELISYFDFLIKNAPEARTQLDWFEANKIPMNVRLSPQLAGGSSIQERRKNMDKAIWDYRMYAKRKKDLESRMKKKSPASPNELRNLQYPM